MRWTIIIILCLLCKISCFAQVINNPEYERTSYEVLHPHVDKVEKSKDSIKVYCSISYQDGWSYNIPKTMFIKDLITNIEYQIIKCIGLPFEPEERVFKNGGTFQFVFCFPHIDNIQTFNLIEDPSKDRIFNIYGIDLSTTNPQTFEETEYKRFKNLSDFYKSSGNNNKFVEFEEKELSAAKYIFGKRSLAADACYNQLANYYNETGDHIKAIEYGLLALECDSIQFGVENKEYPVYVHTLGSLSQYYQSAGNDSEVLRCKEKCINIWKNMGNEDNYLNELYSLLFTGREKIGIVKRIEMVEKELYNLPSYINAISKPITEIRKQMALYYWMIDDNKSAIDCCDRVLSSYRKNGYTNNEEYAEVLASKCKYQRYNNLTIEAIETGESAKQLFDSLNIKSSNYAELMANLAWAYGLLYDFEKSIILQNNSIEIYENVKDWLSLAETYNNISDYYQRAEKLEAAEQYTKKAISVLNDHGDVEQILSADVNRIGDKSIVTPFAKSKIKQRLDYDKINLYQTLASIYQKEGKIKDAIITEKENIYLTKNLGDKKTYALHLMIMANYYFLDKQFDNAKECVEQTFQLEDSQYRFAFNKLLLSQICFEMGDTSKAIQYASESVSFFKSVEDTEMTVTSEYILSLFYWKSNQYSKAEYYLSETLDMLKDKICKEFKGMTSEQKQRIWAIYEKYFFLYRNIIEKDKKDEMLLAKLYDYVLFSKSLLLDSEIDSEGDELSRLKIIWKDIQHRLSDHNIAIEFISTGSDSIYHTYHALIIDRTCKSPNMITLYNESDLELIKQTNTHSIIDIVGNLIWKPILNQYKDINGIYFSPDGFLNILPVEHCNVDGIGEMFDYYNIYRLSSTKEIVFHNQKEIKKNAVLYGGLDYDFLSNNSDDNSYSLWRSINARGGFEPLASTYEEIQDIANLLKSHKVEANLYSGKQGTEDSFKNLSGKEVSMIHLSTHGMYVSPNNVSRKKKENNFDFLEIISNERDPVKEDIVLTHSFLVMSGGNKLAYHETIEPGMNDGILTAFEISQLDLSKLDLVVLSACETGLGDLDNGGVYGLQRGFKKAGTNTILMSLDKVDDEATKILMVEFYKNLTSGKSKHQSLKDAQKYLRQIDNGKYNKPEYWASFIMLDGLD